MTAHLRGVALPTDAEVDVEIKSHTRLNISAYVAKQKAHVCLGLYCGQSFCVDEPILQIGERATWLVPAVVTDPSDPRLAHLDGLNLSRAWMLDGIAAAMDANDVRRPAIVGAAQAHRDAGLARVTGEHYEGGHWLGSFAVYLVTRRGI